MTKNLDELKAQVQMANLAYARGNPLMSDQEYDKLWQILRDLDPSCPLLYHTAQDPAGPAKVFQHAFPIYGTQKAFVEDDLKPFLARFGSEELVLEPKYDGCAAVLNRKAAGYQLVKEGDGLKGEDISHHLIWINLEGCPIRRTIVGEVVIPLLLWNPEFGANPRNTVGGWLNSDNAPEHAKAQFVPHNLSPLSCKYRYVGDLSLMTTQLLELFASWSKLYPIDGIMIKVKDPKRRLIAWSNGTFYNWCIAWKPPMQTAETTVTKVEWNVSRSGRVIPTVCFSEVELCGTRNSRATGNNAQWLSQREISPGDKILVGKAGEIIPKILEVYKTTSGKSSAEPLYCPVCGSKLSWKGVDLVCSSSKCVAQLSKSLAYFYSDKGMELKSIGEKRIFELLQNPALYETLKNHPWALLNLDYFCLEKLAESLWGEKIYNTYVEERQNLSGTKNPAHFIAALGYPGLAYKTAIKLFHYLYGSTLRDNVSQKAQANFVLALTEWKVASKLLPKDFFAPLPKAASMIFCITGILSDSRTSIITSLQRSGWEFSKQVSKHTDYLVVGKSGTGTTKYQKAKEKGVPMISEEQLYELVDKGALA